MRDVQLFLSDDKGKHVMDYNFRAILIRPADAQKRDETRTANARRVRKKITTPPNEWGPICARITTSCLIIHSFLKVNLLRADVHHALLGSKESQKI